MKGLILNLIFCSFIQAQSFLILMDDAIDSTNFILSEENVSFEGGTVGNWVAAVNGVGSASTTQAIDGTYSYKFVSSGAGTGNISLNEQYFTNSTSDLLRTTLSVYKSATGVMTVRVYNNDNTYASTTTNTANAWVTLTINHTGVRGAAAASQILIIVPNNETVYVDRIWTVLR